MTPASNAAPPHRRPDRPSIADPADEPGAAAHAIVGIREVLAEASSRPTRLRRVRERILDVPRDPSPDSFATRRGRIVLTCVEAIGTGLADRVDVVRTAATRVDAAAIVGRRLVVGAQTGAFATQLAPDRRDPRARVLAIATEALDAILDAHEGRDARPLLPALAHPCPDRTTTGPSTKPIPRIVSVLVLPRSIVVELRHADPPTDASPLDLLRSHRALAAWGRP